MKSPRNPGHCNSFAEMLSSSVGFVEIKSPRNLGIATLKRLIFPSENAPSRNEKPKIPGIATD